MSIFPVVTEVAIGPVTLQTIGTVTLLSTVTKAVPGGGKTMVYSWGDLSKLYNSPRPLTFETGMRHCITGGEYGGFLCTTPEGREEYRLGWDAGIALLESDKVWAQ